MTSPRRTMVNRRRCATRVTRPGTYAVRPKLGKRVANRRFFFRLTTRRAIRVVEIGHTTAVRYLEFTLLDLDTLSRPAGRADFFRRVQIIKACDEQIVRRLASPAEARSIELEPPTVQTEITDGRPVRRILLRTTAKWTGYFFSAKSGPDGLMVPWESFNERNALTKCECDPRVTSFVTQPFTLRYPWVNGYREYTPDIFVWRKRKAHVVEAKWSEKTADPEFRLKTRLFEQWFARRQVRYEVWTEHDLALQPRLSNWQLLLRARTHQVDPQIEFLIRERLRSYPSSSIDSVLKNISDSSPFDIHALILRGVLSADLDFRPLTEASPVFLAKEPVQ